VLTCRTSRLDLMLFAEAVVAPVFLHLDVVQQTIRNGILVAAQNCSKTAQGAFTGEVRYLLTSLLYVARPIQSRKCQRFKFHYHVHIYNQM